MKNLTLYSAKICPFAQRVTFALAHLEVPHQLVEIDLQNKPKDYATINRALKVPVLQIEHTATGGRKSSAYFPESLIILELLSDLYPYKIMSEDALKRAESRYFVCESVLSSSLSSVRKTRRNWHFLTFPLFVEIARYAEVVTPNFIKYIYGEDQSAIAPLLAGLKEIQGLLTANEGHYFQGDSVSYADFAVAPFLGRMLTFGKAGAFGGRQASEPC